MNEETHNYAGIQHVCSQCGLPESDPRHPERDEHPSEVTQAEKLARKMATEIVAAWELVRKAPARGDAAREAARPVAEALLALREAMGHSIHKRHGLVPEACDGCTRIVAALELAERVIGEASE